MKFKKTMFLLTLFILMLEFSTYILACTGVIVGKGLTSDGSYIFGRNEDFPYDPTHNKNFVVREGGKNKPGEIFKDESNGFTYPLPETRYKYFSVPDVTPEEGIFDEAGFNEFGVAIDTTVSANSNDKIKKIDPYVKDGLAESAMPTVILPYVKTAREGVLRLAEIIKTKGAAEGNILVIADKKEMWYIEIYSGHQFVAIKYPDDKFSVFPNTFFLGTIDLNDKNNVIKSDGIEKVAKETKTELFFGCLWASIKRELEVKCYLDDIIKVAEEKSKNNQYDAICYLIDQKYTYHKNILDNPKDDFIYREEINNIIFDYLQLKVNEISEQQPPQPQPFAPIVPKKPFKWNANKKSLGTLFGVLFNHGIITGNKDDFKRQLITLFEGAPSLSYLNDLINLSSDKTNPNEPVPKYCADTEELLTDWIEFLQDTPTKQK